MKENGTVVERKGTLVRVELPAGTACRTCSAGLFCRPRGEARYVWAKDLGDAQVGDSVTVELSEGRSVLLSFLLFLVPLLLLALVYVAFKALIGSELWSIVPAILVALGYFAVLRGSRMRAAFTVRGSRPPWDPQS
jgi:positive regulator of sigma E activity